MSENLNLNSKENDQFNSNNPKDDYEELINRLKEIKSTIALVEKKIFK